MARNRDALSIPRSRPHTTTRHKSVNAALNNARFAARTKTCDSLWALWVAAPAAT